MGLLASLRSSMAYGSVIGVSLEVYKSATNIVSILRGCIVSFVHIHYRYDDSGTYYNSSNWIYHVNACCIIYQKYAYQSITSNVKPSRTATGAEDVTFAHYIY